MELTIGSREVNKKSTLYRIRFTGDIPAVLYAPGVANEAVVVKGEEFSTHLRQIKPGNLSTTIFTLKKEDGKKVKAIVKDIQYHFTTYDILHIDFEVLQDHVPVTLYVPIEYLGSAECEGVKQGGFVREVIRRVKVKCLPKHIPSSFSLDITQLGVFQSKRLSDIKFPAHVQPIALLSEVAVVVSKRT